MVDTLAPKKIFTQRNLDSSLSESNKVNVTNGSATSMVDSLPKINKQNPLINTMQPDYLINVDDILTKRLEKSAPSTSERNQTIKSSSELTDAKQTGAAVKKDVSQGLGSSPIAYAADGFEDKIIDRPVVVGERGVEMIVPTGKNKFSVVSNEALKGLMTKISDDSGSDYSGVDLSKNKISEFKNEDGTDRAAISGNDEVPDPKIGSTETLILLERLDDQGVDTTDPELRKSIMDYIKGADNTYYDELLNPPEVEIIPEEKVQPLMGKDEV
tara:strand:+ start:956 stop:1768 length:813 start_codon:yes stop_codon:yes gene_type:complete